MGGGAYFWSAWAIITFSAPHIGLWWANIIGNGVGIMLNFLIQKFWTFGSDKNILNSGWKFIVLTLFNLVLSYFILKQFIAWGVALWLAQFFSASIFTVWNWVMYKTWVFKETT